MGQKLPGSTGFGFVVHGGMNSQVLGAVNQLIDHKLLFEGNLSSLAYQPFRLQRNLSALAKGLHPPNRVTNAEESQTHCG
ncbi:hypothetical protein [Roseobacter sp. EG26]|uniref:hypothetical protein n=1 Tax=Roseobacter sp. EG26 TaxID=3412477 RepID=UPI003CE5ABAE